MNIPDEAQAAMVDGSCRFTDADVRANPLLLAQAVTFLQTYFDDWKPLRDARLMAAATGTLTVPVARMVLNCMRTNPAARFDNVVPIHAGIEIGEEVDEGPRPAPFAETSPAIRDWQERKAAEAERDRVSWVHNDPYWMNQARRFHGSVFTKFTPKFRFAVSGHPPATKRVWHLVNLDACRTEWRNGEVYAYHVSLWCKGRNDHMVFRPDHNFELGGFLFASLPDERKICAMCPKHREESKNR